MKHLYGLRREELADWLKTELNEPSYRATQLFEWMYQKRVTKFKDMTNLPKHLRTKLEESAVLDTSAERLRQTSKDGTVKFLLGWSDAVTAETVLMRHDYGNSVCVSSQIGCKMGCNFCASTLGGMIRQVSAGEMVEQLLHSQKLLDREGGRVSSIVMMGSGEPMDNLDEVFRFMDIVHDEKGLNIGFRHITISTVGIVPGIKRLADDGRPVTLAVSLHAVTDEKRSSMMPVNKAYPIAKLLDACHYYVEHTGKRISFEYALIGGENDSLQDARNLANLLKEIPNHINLIPVNYVPERDYTRTPEEQVEAFVKELQRLGMNATVRREKGHDISAACGQLRAEHEKQGVEN
ncbi:23S rRNA (adenine(2503)-C(2))-methyltransferase RlmN [Alicyclobacillus sp. SO9]|uniref:23S rRNA (adenine(2503)-C(2))-methyltransferase RlmN n=1 Tax=Alicyclobacillus sp. SO9 TaxID=2665646 RepID=UPI001E2CBAF1|nr:23S rRNA (adenine(2503)-C(2))-methyltransferase RlmN [Alicyclobacillus sp. SO9]